MLVDRVWAIFGVSCLGLGTLSGLRSEAEPSSVAISPSLHEIRQSIDRGRVALRSLQVEAFFTSRSHRSGSWIKQRLHVTFAAAGYRRYADTIHLTDGVDEDQDDYRNQMYLERDTLEIFFPFQRRCERQHGAKVFFHAHEIRAHFFLECLGQWPAGDESSPPKRADHAFFIHELLAERGCRLLNESELVNGVPCRVIEDPNVEKLWLDPQKNFALTRRDWFAELDGLPSVRYELSEYKEVTPGIWFPWMLRRIVYDRRSEPTQVDPPVEMETIARVERVIVNRVSNDLFRFHPPPGTLIWDRDSDERWQTPGGLSWLDEVIHAVHARNTRRAALAPSSRSRPIHQDAKPYGLVIVIFFLTILDMFLLYQTLRRIRRSHTTSPPQTSAS